MPAYTLSRGLYQNTRFAYAPARQASSLCASLTSTSPLHAMRGLRSVRSTLLRRWILPFCNAADPAFRSVNA